MPRSMASRAPASSAISSSSRPSGLTRRPTKPPPPMNVTVSANGCSRVQKLNPTVRCSPRNGHVAVGAQADVLQGEHADGDVRQREREAGAHAIGRHVEERRVGEPVERDQLAQRVDERQGPEELDAAEHHVDLGLARRAGPERQALEVQRHQRGRRDEVEVEAPELGQHVDDRFGLGAHPGLDGDRQPAPFGFAHREDGVRRVRPRLHGWRPVETGADLEVLRIDPLEEADHGVDGVVDQGERLQVGGQRGDESLEGRLQGGREGDGAHRALQA